VHQGVECRDGGLDSPSAECWRDVSLSLSDFAAEREVMQEILKFVSDVAAFVAALVGMLG
jgi:hypothetical protein